LSNEGAFTWRVVLEKPRGGGGRKKAAGRREERERGGSWNVGSAAESRERERERERVEKSAACSIGGSIGASRSHTSSRGSSHLVGWWLHGHHHRCGGVARRGCVEVGVDGARCGGVEWGDGVVRRVEMRRVDKLVEEQRRRDESQQSRVIIVCAPLVLSRRLCAVWDRVAVSR
jgi:hypothetical protein